jgi:undecaprenyl-diphosphatase
MRRLLHHPFVRRHLTLAALFRALRQPAFLAILAFIFGVWGFIKLSEAVSEGSTKRFDEAVLRALREPGNPKSLIGPPWIEQTLRDFTALGGEPVLALLTAIVVGYFGLAGRHDLSLTTLLAAIGGGLLTFGLKDYFERPRPELVPYILVAPSSTSFPSGHAMASAFIYLTLGAMLSEVAQTRRLKAYVMAVAVFLTLLIGVTRVCLGVHFPTDILAGWTAGFLWVYACRSAVRLARFLWGLRRAKETHHAPAETPPAGVKGVPRGA